MCLATTLLKDEESSRDNHFLACNFAKYSPIKKNLLTVSNKRFLIWLLTTPPHLKYVATLPCNLSLIASFQTLMFHKVVWHTHTHPFNGPFSWTTRVGRYQKGKTNLDFTEARDSEWQWHQLSHMQVCTLFQTDNHASISPLSFLQAGCPSCRPTNSVKALKAIK